MGMRRAFKRLFGDGEELTETPVPSDPSAPGWAAGLAGHDPAAPSAAPYADPYGQHPVAWGAPPAVPGYGVTTGYLATEPTGYLPPAAAPVPTPAPVPVAAPGELVLGSVERRVPPPDLPDFYVPQSPPPPPPSAFPAGQADYDPALVKEAFTFVSDRADRLVTNFYAELFLRLREAPTMFPSSMTQQRQELGRALVQWVVADDPETLTGHLQQLGDDHRKFEVEPRHYEIAGAALVSAWKNLAGSHWTQAHEDAVVGSYTRLASTMIDGAMKHAHEPASWGAQVVSHERLATDFAVLRIQPDAPYPYKAGQFVTLELPSHRRQWRSMSIASAPRRDNTFDIHVRGIGASGVSAALVAHTRVGDRLKLGPPRGNDLVVEPGTVPGGLLCVASGTGAAPITAVVESILAWPDAPHLYTFVGGRNREDTYSVDRMFQLIQSGGYWNTAEVHAVLSDDPGYVGYRGRVEEIVPGLRDWAQLGVDVLIAGPNPMIATTVQKLADGGVPMSKIHFDQFEMVS